MQDQLQLHSCMNLDSTERGLSNYLQYIYAEYNYQISVFLRRHPALNIYGQVTHCAGVFVQR